MIEAANDVAKYRLDCQEIKFGDDMAALHLDKLRARAARMVRIALSYQLSTSLFRTNQAILGFDELTWRMKVADLARGLLKLMMMVLRVWITPSATLVL